MSQALLSVGCPSSCPPSPWGGWYSTNAAWSPSGEQVAGALLLDLFPADFESAVPAVAWSPDGKRIVTLSEDQVGRVWDASTGESLLIFTGLSGADCAQWSPSGDRILASGLGGVAKVWDANNGDQVAAYDVGTMAVASWSPDGELVAINDHDGNLKVYPAWQTLDALVAYAKECCLFRALTPEERAQFGLPPR